MDFSMAGAGSRPEFRSVTFTKRILQINPVVK
jgi:hypothetical protein